MNSMFPQGSGKWIGGVSTLFILLVLFLSGGWTVADDTEHCFKLRYGRIIDDNVGSGLHPEWWIFDYECLPMIEQQIPDVSSDDDTEWATVSFETADRMNVTVPFRTVVQYDPGAIRDVFLAKRTQEAILADVNSGLMTGAAQAGNSMTLDDIFDGGLENLQERMRGAMQNEVGSLARVVRVFVLQPEMPPQIRAARDAARQAEENIRQIRQEFVSDSINAEKERITAEVQARATVARATAYADSVRLTMTAEAAAFAQNRELSELRQIEASSEAIARLLSNCESNCFVGAQMIDRALAAWGGGR